MVLLVLISLVSGVACVAGNVDNDAYDVTEACRDSTEGEGQRLDPQDGQRGLWKEQLAMCLL